MYLDDPKNWELHIYSLLCIVLSRILRRSTDAEAEAAKLWPPDVNCWLIRKDPDAGKDWEAGGEEGDRGWDD